MTDRVPVLGEDPHREVTQDAIYFGHNLVARVDCKRTTRAEIVLDVDHDDRVFRAVFHDILHVYQWVAAWAGAVNAKWRGISPAR